MSVPTDVSKSHTHRDYDDYPEINAYTCIHDTFFLFLR